MSNSRLALPKWVRRATLLAGITVLWERARKGEFGAFGRIAQFGHSRLIRHRIIFRDKRVATGYGILELR